MSTVEIRPVRSRRDLREFIELPYRLHATSPRWVPPLRIERRLFLNRKLNAFFNTCPHRGAEVARERKGNQKYFQCFYHGWVFSADGALKNQPGEARYSASFKEQQRGNLVPVPRFDNYRGMCFVNFDPQAGSLEDYLGNNIARLCGIEPTPPPKDLVEADIRLTTTYL